MEQEEFAELGRRVGVPVQAVYQEAELVELLTRVPPEQLLQGGREKGLVRRTLAQRFPDLGFGAQRKMISAQTYAHAVNRDAPAVWSQLGGLRVLRALGVVSSRLTAQPAPDALYGNPTAQASLVASALCLEAWTRSRADGR